MSILERIGVSKPKRIPSGLFTYRGEGEYAGLALQLRVEPDGHGLLVVNANSVLYLNETATALAYYFMHGHSTDDAVRAVRRLYRVDDATARKDYEQLVYTISTLAQTEEVCPLTFLDVEHTEPFSESLSAPIRMDLALTFRCNNDCVHCYAGGPHETPEMSTDDWKRVIDKCVSLGIFILTFTGGEPTLREDLAELLAYAQAKGAVTGLVTNGRRLKDEDYVKKLGDAGLDFAQITLESHIPEIHDEITGVRGSWAETVEGIRTVEKSQIYLSTNTTLNKKNYDSFMETIDFIKELGVAAFGCNGLIYSGSGPAVAKDFALTADELKELLPKVVERAHVLGMKFNWFTPTQYCELNPLQLGLGIKSCSACRSNMCVGPEGDVYPCQSYFTSLGKILKDDWDSIWNHRICKEIRERRYAPEKCKDCPELSICGGGCLLELMETGKIGRCPS
jgi:radical SAM protein with 4Fe4S-binding SPASM domain